MDLDALEDELWGEGPDDENEQEHVDNREKWKCVFPIVLAALPGNCLPQLEEPTSRSNFALLVLREAIKAQRLTSSQQKGRRYN